jgi:lipopolysaccharide biosynthesis glycosyltransferase
MAAKVIHAHLSYKRIYSHVYKYIDDLFKNPMTKQEQAIHTGFAFDQNYITPFYVLLTSLFHNNKSSYLVIHSIATGISEQEKKNIQKYVQQHNADIFFYNIDEDYVRRNVVIPENHHFTIATYYRLFLPALLPPSVKKLLFIDTDVVVTGDLRELYHTDIGNAPFGAVPDSYPHIRTDLDLQERSQYFNAGVLLIDVENWKRSQVADKAMQFIAKYPEKIKYVDQDALNATQKGAWFTLSGKYNVAWFDVTQHVSRKKLVKNAVIIHYTTSNKPWNALGGNKLRYVYHKYLQKSPCASSKKYVDFEWNATFLKRFLFMRFMEWYYEHPQIVAIYRKIMGKSR